MSVSVAVQIMPANLATWVDMPVVVSSGLTITRGRSDLTSSIEAGTFSFTGDNTGGDWNPYVGQRLPVRVYVRGQTRYTGTTQMWSRVWPTGDVSREDVEVSCVDMWAQLERAPQATVIDQVIKGTSPLAYYPLTDGQAPAKDASGNGQPDLLVQTMGSPTSQGVTFARGTGSVVDEDPTILFAPTGNLDGQYLQTLVPLSGASVSKWTIHFLMQSTQVISSGLVQVGDVTIGCGSIGGVQQVWLALQDKMVKSWAVATVGDDPLPITITGYVSSWVSLLRCFVGPSATLAKTATDMGPLSFNLTDFSASRVRLGAPSTWGHSGVADYASTGLYSGSLGKFSIWDRVLKVGDIGTIHAAETTGYKASGLASLNLWATMAGVTNSVFDTPTDSPQWTTMQIGSVADLYTAAANTEGGLSYVDRDGTLRFYRRNSPTLPANNAAGDDLFASTFPSTFGTAAASPPLTIDMLSPDGGITNDWSTAMGTCTGTTPDGQVAQVGTDTTLSAGSIATVTSDPYQNSRATEATLAANSGITKMPSITIDLQALTGDNVLGSPGISDPRLSWLQAMDIGSTIQISGLPGRPDGDPYCLLGYTETVTHDTWTMSCNVLGTGPGTPSDLFILDSSTGGNLDSTQHLDWGVI